jgi:hypothetical protein
MTEEEDNILYGNISSIYHEIRPSFYYLFSICSFLEGKVPDLIENLLGEIVQICSDLRIEIDDLPSIYSFHSADEASNQLRTYAIKWKKELGSIGDLINEIMNFKIQLEDVSLNKFLNESLYYSFQKFSTIVDYLLVIQARDLKVSRF